MTLLEVKGNDADADIPGLRATSVIVVSGYDIGLGHDAVVRMLKTRLSQCGEITDVFVAKCDDHLNKYAFVYFWGKSAADKAVLLNGSDFGGWKALVEPDYFIDDRSCAMSVIGFDKSLDTDDIKMALTKHFSSCGKVYNLVVSKSNDSAVVYISGKDATHKALKLGLTSIQGREVVTKLVSRPINPTAHTRRCLGGSPGPIGDEE